MSELIKYLPKTKAAIMQVAGDVMAEVSDAEMIHYIAEIEAATLYLESCRKALEPRIIAAMEAGQSVEVDGIKVACFSGREQWDFGGNLTWVDLQGKLAMAKDQVKVIQGEIDALEGYLKKAYHSQLADTSTGEVLQRAKFEGCGKPQIRISIPNK